MSSVRCKNYVRLGLLSAAAVMALGAQAEAAGFYLQEQSVTGLGTAYSGGASNAQDASTVFYNPAGMTNLSGTQLQIGAINIAPSSKLTNTGSTLSATGNGPAGGGDGGNPYDYMNLVPHAYITHQLDNNIWLGMAVTVPYGLSEEYDKGWFGRYNSTKTELKVLDFQPSVAYKINNQWSIGGGLDFQYATAVLEANPSISGVGSAVSQLKGHDWATGVNFGVQFHPTDLTTLGLTYRSQVGHELEGHIQTSSLAGVTTLPGHANLDLPDQVTFGATHKLDSQWTIQGQVSWFNWSRFHDITAITNTGTVASATVEDYDDSYSFAAGTEYKANDSWTFRGGMQYDQTPTGSHRDTRVPDGDRTWLALGGTYNITPQLGLNFGGAYLWVDSNNINVTTSGGALGSETVRATTKSHVEILGLDMSYKF